MLDGDWSKRNFVKLVLYFMFKALCVQGCSLFVFLEQVIRQKEDIALQSGFSFVDGVF